MENAWRRIASYLNPPGVSLAIAGRKGAYLLRDVRSARLSANSAESRA